MNTTINLSEENLKQAFPEELMDKVAEYAINEYEAGNCIPNSQVKDNILDRLGWKYQSVGMRCFMPIHLVRGRGINYIQ